MAILLGLAATKLGTADPPVSRTLCLHLPSLLAPSHWDLDVSPTLQAAALAGLGLLHCGTANRLITEFLLAEMSRQPARDSHDTREACSLAAGWALGMNLLHKGNVVENLKGLADLRLEERLLQMITGNSKAAESFLFPGSGATSGSGRSTKILESEGINADVTAPGAIISLALMYLQSSNASVASRIGIPTNAYELDAIRPDILLFRAMGWCLIMWKTVEQEFPADGDEWLENIIPAIVLNALSSPLPSTAPLNAYAAFPVYICILSGYCLGVGLIFAGTADERVKGVLLEKLKFLQRIRDSNNSKFPPLVVKNSRGILEMCVSCVSLSLAGVMAGTGDVDCLRIFRELRWKHDDGLFGYHMR